MQQFEIGGEANCLYYVSSKCRSWIPAKTLLVFAHNSIARSIVRLREFARSSGWMEAAEENGAVLILPVAEKGWEQEKTQRVKLLYRTVWKDTLSPDPNEIFKNVWCWETLIFAVGYGEGAVFAGNAAVEQPNAFADVAMVGGVPKCYEGGEAFSDRWLLPDASDDWRLRNREIPVAVWMLGDMDTGEAERYFGACASDPDQVKVTRGHFGPDPETTRSILAEFDTRVRWKNSPDGTPARLQPEEQIRTGGEYLPDTVRWNGYDYNYYTRLPKGVSDVRGLPVVVCMHGHGEPAWMFAQKNGWPELQDETGAFVFVSPDSPENSWTVQRDHGMHALMLQKLEEKYGIDRTRVYLTGFSNGSMATCWYGTMHPELYAAISPWNSPLVSFEEKLLSEGWEMPVFAINGDLDHKMDIPRKSYAKLFETFIRLNGGLPRKAEVPMPWHWKYDAQWNGENRYTSEAGYRQGGRMTTYEYQNLDGYPRFCFTELKDMPHGAIQDEARAAWAFLSRFSRPLGSKKVVDSGRPELDRNFTQSILPDGREMVVFVPTACNAYTPARSILLLPEAKEVPDPEAVKAWMASSGWIRQANRDGSVLIAATSRFGSWNDVSSDIVKDLYSLTWGKTVSREYGDILWRPTSPENGKRQGCVWMWETLWHIVGYGDGAVVAGNAAAAHPNHFASVTLIGGAPDTFPDREVRSDHFLVSKAGKNPDRMKGISADYDVRVADVPSAVWMIGRESKEALDYFLRADSVPKGFAGTSCILAGEESTLYANPEESAQRVAVTKAAVIPTPAQIMADWMGQSVRWKNGPDGTLSTFYWKDQIEAGQSPYERYPFRVPCENRDREYYVYRPKSIGPKAPVVITIHGHGEPAWMFLSKNGWPELADREGILIVSPQDNHKNRWYGEADNESFRYLVEDVLHRFDVDPQRIYISGFSNGNMQCYGAAAAHPELFAAMWPMSRAAGAPMFPLEPGVMPDLERLRGHGMEMPMFGVTGDNDGWIAEHPEKSDSSISETVETFLALAGTKPRKAENPSPMYWQPDEHRGEAWYREHYGFRQADRFDTWVYHNTSGEPRVCITVMKNMPHGTITEETVAAWDFMKHFRRHADGTIEYR